MSTLLLDPSLAGFEKKALEAAAMLKALSNEKRLMILCQLADGELAVGEIQARLDLSQSALSQHLARLREEGLVAFTRDAQVLRYRIADARIEALLATLYQLYCTPTPSHKD